MKITGKIATLVLLIVFFVGLSVLLYPAVSQYWNSKVQSKSVIDYEELIADVDSEEYKEYMEEANKYNEALSELSSPMTQYEQVEGYEDTLNVSGDGMIGYVSIDKIKVELPIYHGTSIEVLSNACGHIEGTSLPVGGLGTHSVLSAHRGLPNAKLFTSLDKLQLGDTFTVTVLGETLTYQVDQIKIVEPDDVTYLQPETGKDYCTLLTCTPYGINSHRLLVRGTRIESKEQKKLVITSEAYQIDRLIVTPIMALPILFILIVYVIFKPVKKKVKYEDL